MSANSNSEDRPRRAPAKTIPAEPGTHPVPGMRKVIAKRLTESMQNSPHFYLTAEIDMEPAAEFREKQKAEDRKISYNDLILKAVGLALKQHPLVNAYFKGNEVEVLEDANVGFAVALEQGLKVPVIRNADTKSLEEIGAEAKDLADRAREDKLQMSEIQGGSITVSNLGMYDVENFTAIINPPQSTILAISSIRKKPAVVDDEVRPALRMSATLSSDHRIVDGVMAAEFMKTVKELLEKPGEL